MKFNAALPSDTPLHLLIDSRKTSVSLCLCVLILCNPAQPAA